MKDTQYIQVATLAGQNFTALILDLEDDAKRAMAQLLEDTQESNKTPSLTISAQVKVAFTANPVTMTTTAAVTVKAKAETSNELDDPDQVKLGLDEPKVIIKTASGSVTAPLSAMKKAVSKVRGKN